MPLPEPLRRRSKGNNEHLREADERRKGPASGRGMLPPCE